MLRPSNTKTTKFQYSEATQGTPGATGAGAHQPRTEEEHRPLEGHGGQTHEVGAINTNNNNTHL